MGKVLNKPFLKWAGGKSQIAGMIAAHAPRTAFRLVEPFVGSASFALNVNGASGHLLADVNPDLIGLYRSLIAGGNDFVGECRSLFVPGNNTREAYDRLRDEFNSSSDERRRACLFVYLNRHCFNGLMRYNSSGMFNTPFGRYRSPSLPENSMRRFLIILGNARFVLSDFRPVMSMAGAGDFVYCDPPYVPVGDTGFTAYSKGGFSLDDHRDLAGLCREASGRGATVVVSNHDAPWIRDLYVGASIRELKVKRTIGGKDVPRVAADELLAVYSGTGQTEDIFGD